MKKLTKALVGILLIVVLSMTNLTVFADNGEIESRLSHASEASFAFSAYNNVGCADVSYVGSASFVRADLHIKVEKKILLVFWKDVYEWSASNTVSNGGFHQTHPLDGSGTYRATLTLTLTGSDGTSETIEHVTEREC